MAHIFARGIRVVRTEQLRLRAVPVVGLVVLAELIAGNITLSAGLDIR